MKRLLSIFALAALLAPAAAAAGPLETRVGKQYLTAGMQLQPGFLHDPTVPSGSDWNNNAVTMAGMVRVGFVHVLSLPFTMGAEFDLGRVWYDEHTLNTVGAADSEFAWSFQVGLTGRWFFWEEGDGPSLGFGMHARWDLLEDVTYNAFAPHLRLGWTWWQAERSLQLEVGYTTPAIAGLNYPTDFTGTEPDPAPQDSRLHRFSIGFNVGW